MRADAWAALAAWVTAVTAIVTVIVAGSFANRQVKAALAQIEEARKARQEQDEHAQKALEAQARLTQQTLEHEASEAQKTRDEQAQPNVVIFTEQNQAIWYALEIVVKNFGTTPAYDVRLSFDPKPMVSPHASGDTRISELWIPEVIPTLAPMQEWRTLWDVSHKRFEFDELPSRHEATATYTDSSGRERTTNSVLDWNTLKGTHRLEIKTIHSVAKLIEKQNDKLDTIARALNAFGNPNKGVWVFGADAVQELQERNADAEERRRQMDDLEEQLGLRRREAGGRPATPTSPDGPAPDPTTPQPDTEPPSAPPPDSDLRP